MTLIAGCWWNNIYRTIWNIRSKQLVCSFSLCSCEKCVRGDHLALHGNVSLSLHFRFFASIFHSLLTFALICFLYLIWKIPFYSLCFSMLEVGWTSWSQLARPLVRSFEFVTFSHIYKIFIKGLVNHFILSIFNEWKRSYIYLFKCSLEKKVCTQVFFSLALMIKENYRKVITNVRLLVIMQTIGYNECRSIAQEGVKLCWFTWAMNMWTSNQ